MGISGRIARFFQDSQLTPLAALVALLLGLFAVIVTPREEEPQIDVTMVNVFVPFPGASVRDVESLVTIPAEQVLGQMSGIEHIHSVSRSGMAIVTVQFKVGVPRTEAIVRTRDTLSANRDWVSPELGVLEPVIKPRGIDDVPIVALTLFGAGEQGAFDLERVAHSIEGELKRVPGTREVSTLGGPGRAVRVLLDADRMNASGISALDVRNALQLANVALPSGSIVRDNREIAVETGNYLESAADVRSLVVGAVDRRPVYLGDIAEVVDGPDRPSRYVWTGTGPAAGTKGIPATGELPAVTLQVTKKAGENAVDVAARVVDRMQELRGTLIPADVHYVVTRNYGLTADDKATSLIKKLVFATLSVVVLVFVTLGWREALIVGVAVVLTLAATLFASWAWGFTLNRVSLFALIFSIGILVDDAIVVVENIHRHGGIETGPMHGIIPEAVDEVGGPTILATLAVIAALLPMAFVSGLMGPYMSPIPINASLGMIISLAIAFTVTPWLALKLLHRHADAKPSTLDAKLERLFTRLLAPFILDESSTGVGPQASKTGVRPRRNRRLLGLAVLVLIAASLGLAGVKLVVLKMLPFDNKSEFQVVVDLPAGTPVEVTAAALHDLGAHIATVPEVTDYQAYAGLASPINFNGLVRQYALRAEPFQGDLQVNLADKSKRDRKSHEIAQAVRPKLEEIGARWNARVKVVEVPPGPPVLSPIVAEVYGPDEAGRIRVAKRVREALAATPGVVGIDDSVEEVAPRLMLRVDQAKAALLGISRREVVDTVRMGLDGTDVTPIHDGNSKYEVPVRVVLPAERHGEVAELLKLTLRAPDGALVPLSELVRVVSNDRDRPTYRKDFLPVVHVVADEAGELDSPLYGMFSARSRIWVGKPGSEPIEYFITQPSDAYREYAIKWDGEWQVTYETFRDMGLAYAVGLVLIYLLVVAQFRSYLVPLVIMAPIPLTVIGVMPGHALLGAQFTATSMIGMIALAGIIVRNSILLVDFVNLRLAEGVPVAEAVMQSAAARAKPIALTALAAMIGAGFILDDPIFNGLAISLIFGILVSTLLTLLVIPVLYFLVRAPSRDANPDANRLPAPGSEHS